MGWAARITGMKAERRIAIVQTTVSARAEAEALAALVLKNRLGACIQITPIKSIYRWRGKNESANELLVSVKTSPGAAGRLAAFIKKHHPYELPEIISLNARASREYAAWAARETKRP